MITGYIRQDVSNSIDNGNIIDAQDLDNEFNAVQEAFNAGNGHRHNGASGEGAPITVLGPSQEVDVSTTSMKPTTTNTIDLGITTQRWKTGWFTGAVTAGSFAGNGANLTDLNAANVLTGILPAARLSGNYSNVTGVGTLTSGQIGSGFGNVNIGSNTFTGNGSGITNLNASALSSGTIPNVRLSGPYTDVTGVGNLTAGSISSGFGSINIGSNTFTGNGSGLTNLNASNLTTGSIPAARLASTDLDASNLTSGTVPTSRLPLSSAAGTWVRERYSGVSAGEIGSLALMLNQSGVTLGTGSDASGSELRYSSVAGNSGGTPAGIWKCMSQTPNNSVGLFVRLL